MSLLPFSRGLSVMLAFLLGAMATARADPALDRISARGHVVVSVKNEGRRDQGAHKDPAHFQKRDFEIAIARELAAALPGDPTKLELRMMRRPERLPAVAEGQVDLGISMLRVSPKSAAKVDFSIPYFRGALAAMHKPGLKIRQLSDLDGRAVAYIARNDDGAGDLPDSVKPGSVQEFADFDAAVAALEQGSVEVLVSERANIDLYLARRPVALERSAALLEETMAVAVQKGNPQLLEKVNATLEALAHDGRLDTMARTAGLLAPPLQR